MRAVEWRPVVGLEGRYEVSSDGHVRTLSIRVAARHMGVLKSRVGSRGYPVVTLRDATGKTRCVTLHRLVALAFLGPCPPGKQVAHNDGVRTNVRAENLRYASPAENHADRARHGTNCHGDLNGARMRPERLARGERNGASKLDAQAVNRIRAAHAAGVGQRRIAREHGVSQSTVWAVIARKSWTHVAEDAR